MGAYLKWRNLPSCNITSLAELNAYMLTSCIRSGDTQTSQKIHKQAIFDKQLLHMCHSSNTHSKSGQLATLDHLITHANFRIQAFLVLDYTLLSNCLVWSCWSVMQYFIAEPVPTTRHICSLNFWIDTDQRNTITLQGWFGLFSSCRWNSIFLFFMVFYRVPIGLKK